MKAIHQSIVDGKLNAKINLILSDNPKAEGLQYAAEHQLPTEVIQKGSGESREDYDQRLIEKIDSVKPDLIALAGFMRILSPKFVQHYRNRIVNIHPSLLPKFPGLHAQKQALEAGEKQSGCTVHFVDEGCDSGPIIDQRVVTVLPDDTEESLSARILEEEHKLYSDCLQRIAEGKINIKKP
jgi:phosphoribosylglycinamide formyltransferase-1